MLKRNNLNNNKTMSMFLEICMQLTVSKPFTRALTKKSLKIWHAYKRTSFNVRAICYVRNFKECIWNSTKCDFTPYIEMNVCKKRWNFIYSCLRGFTGGRLFCMNLSDQMKSLLVVDEMAYRWLSAELQNFFIANALGIVKFCTKSSI